MGERVGFSETDTPVVDTTRGQHGRLAGGNWRKVRAIQKQVVVESQLQPIEDQGFSRQTRSEGYSKTAAGRGLAAFPCRFPGIMLYWHSHTMPSWTLSCNRR